MTEDRRCAFTTTTPLGAFSQAARSGSPTRYRTCRNRATTSVTVTEGHWSGTVDRVIPCCGLHKRLHDEKGWRP